MSAGARAAGDEHAERPRAKNVVAAGIRPRRPLADEVRDRIVDDYLNGDEALVAGGRLPGEVALSERYGVSRVTLRAALRSLQEAGLISVRHGSGATVLPQANFRFSGLERLCSIETLARESGGTVGNEDVVFERLDADPALAARLEIQPGERVTLVRRVKTYRGERVAYMAAYVPEDVFPATALRKSFRGSVLDILLTDPRFAVEYADCELQAIGLPPEIADKLGVAAGTPTLYLDEVMRSGDGRAVEWGQAWFLPEHFRFTLRRRKGYGQ